MTHTEFCYWLLGHVQSVGDESFYNLNKDLVKQSPSDVTGPVF